MPKSQPTQMPLDDLAHLDWRTESISVLLPAQKLVMPITTTYDWQTPMPNLEKRMEFMATLRGSN